MKTQWMIITPETAKQWVSDHNKNNRNLARSKVIQYATDMKKGNWNTSHQGIAFYENGDLADGQHRLQACVESNVNLESFVTFGVPVIAGSGIDCHRARNMDDQIKIARMSDWVGKDELAIAKLAKRCINKAGGTISSHEAVEFCNAHKESIQAARRALSNRTRNITTAPVALALACAHPYVGDSVIERFSKTLISGLMETKDEMSAIRLRERLLSDGSAFVCSATGRNDLVRLTMRAIKAFANREQLSKLQLPDKFIYPVLGDVE